MFHLLRSPHRSSHQPLAKRRKTFRLEPLEDRRLTAVLLNGTGLESSGGQVYDFGQVAGITSVGDAMTAADNVFGAEETFTIPALNSLPGAPVSLFLDFDGHLQSGNVIGGKEFVETPVFNVVGTPKDDNDPCSFSKHEQDVIRAVWAIVAEDYAPFNINVTTVEPTDATRNLRIAIGGDGLWYKGGEAGGTSHINSFTDDAPNVAYVFPVVKPGLPGAGTTLSAGWIGNAVSHEAGHSFGLRHQSLGAATPLGWIKVEEYNSSKTATGGRMIMGALTDSDGKPFQERFVWWRGTDPHGNIQDDMAVLARAENGFGLRADDHAETIVGASQMKPVKVTLKTGFDLNTNADKFTTFGLEGSGIISTTADRDTFHFETGGGNVTVVFQSVRAAEVGLPANLRATVRLLDANGATVLEEYGATGISDLPLFDVVNPISLPAGTYFVQIESSRVALDLGYGDVGQYRLLVAEDSGPRVIKTDFTTADGLLTGLMVTFNEPIKAWTFTAADVRVGDGAPGVGVVDVVPWGDGKRFLINLTPTTETRVSVGPNIADQFGNLMDQNQNGVNGELNDYLLAVYPVWRRPAGRLPIDYFEE